MAAVSEQQFSYVQTRNSLPRRDGYYCVHVYVCAAELKEHNDILMSFSALHAQLGAVYPRPRGNAIRVGMEQRTSALPWLCALVQRVYP